MHAGKIQAWEVDKGIVTGKDDVLGLYGPMLRHDQVPVNRADRRVLVDGELLRHGAQKFQRMKLGLMGKTDGASHGDRQGRGAHEGGGNPQTGSGPRFRSKQLFVAAVDVCVLLLKIAVDSLGGDEITVCPDGSFVGSGVLHCPVLAQCPDQFIIDHAVLRGDFCRGVSGLAASDAVGLQNDDLVPRLLKCVGNQYPRHAGADDGNLRLPILRQALPGSDLTALGPDGFH